MTYDRAFGDPDGIEKRLVMWRRQLAMDKSYPWTGTGLLDDLVCAAKLLGANVSEFEKPDDKQLDMQIISEMDFDL